jgi:1,2-diacylglycerol 3-beta-glucosyltransferase
MHLEIFFIALLLLYLAKIVFFRTGAARASREVRSDTLPSVSIILAARNEKENIGACLESLSRLDYPADRIEILAVDDQSTDSTRAIMESMKAAIPALRIIETEGTIGRLHGKANAVAQAIAGSTGEIIMTTDADCAVPAAWVRETVAQYSSDTGCVCGFTLLNARSIFTGMQSVDWAYMLSIASAGVGWGFPLSAVGNNMSFRRAAYDEVGGYEGIGFSVTEDFALFKAISETSKWKFRYAVEPATLVWSEPCPTVRELFRQKKRWGRGGMDIRPLGFLIMSVGFLMSVSIIALPWLGLSWWCWMSGLIGKTMGDAILLQYTLRRLRQTGLFRYLPWFELFYIIYVTLLPFVILLTGRVVWKERKL